ncbi:hypothetical protein [Bradyrhizobium iriomotense]|uniref:DUF4148 domain-containing protein n=1 Tax=Bradyrhizobium iriomotense TaxID=441950 RepID=A0ABQ6AMT7_9BRAD|nr:hypothetical protein [Bradyrhizobium iriomotense]GLR83557.1 hypothetical protein GCM10007857_02670 [Bradyrhizobium iriomotense]GLR83562.1 hypothetical protein GCM10007857_02720 [Bradyrhizobium iriomotense]
MTLIQRQSVVLAAALMAALASASARAETTSVNNGSNSATITQSGDPSKTEKKVDTGPGYSRIEQHSGSNSATIIQRSNPAAGDPTNVDPGKGPDAQAAPGEPNGDAERAPPLTDADVYRQIRKGASPQSQQTLDRLMKALGLQNKM